MGPEAETTESGTGDVTAEDIDLIASLDVGDDTDTDTEDGDGEGDGKNGKGDDEAAAAAAAEAEEGKDKTGDTGDKGEAGADDAKWFDDIEDDGLKELASGYGTRDELLKALGVESSADWRASIKDEKARENANRYNSLEDLAKSSLELRQQVSSALVPPGKNSTREERVAFAARLNKMLGVPEEASGYAVSETPEGVEEDESQKAARAKWAGFFHKIHMPKSMADAVVAEFARDKEEGEALVAKQDEDYANATRAELDAEWGDDTDRNYGLAKNTMRELFGDDADEMMKATLTNGRLIMDSAPMLRMLVRVGREMAESGAELLSEEERETIDDQVRDLRERAEKAKNEGNTRLANKLFGQEQALLAKIVPNRPVVGAQGRTA